jgi:hypothetical protein
MTGRSGTMRDALKRKRRSLVFCLTAFTMLNTLAIFIYYSENIILSWGLLTKKEEELFLPASKPEENGNAIQPHFAELQDFNTAGPRK